jgi:hypothetical protein
VPTAPLVATRLLEASAPIGTWCRVGCTPVGHCRSSPIRAGGCVGGGNGVLMSCIGTHPSPPPLPRPFHPAPPSCSTAGQYSSVSGTPSCTPCAPGLCTNSSSTPCEPCPLGRFSNASLSVTCFLCPVGTYAGSTGQTGCTTCPAGRFGAGASCMLSVVCVGWGSGGGGAWCLEGSTLGITCRAHPSPHTPSFLQLLASQTRPAVGPALLGTSLPRLALMVALLRRTRPTLFHVSSTMPPPLPPVGAPPQPWSHTARCVCAYPSAALT